MKNVGTLDRNIRLGLFTAFCVAGVMQGGTIRFVLWGLSGVMFITALAGFCPIWALFRMDTTKK